MWFNQEVEHCKLYSDFFLSVISKDKKHKNSDIFATLQLEILYSF